MSDRIAHPPADVICRLCGNDASADPVQLEDPADDPTAAAGWLCIGCFDATLCPDDLGGMGW